MTCTTKNTQAEIVAEAQAITIKERVAIDAEKQKLIRALREKTGVQYSGCVSKARYQLQILDFSGKRVVVTPVSEYMPIYEYIEFLRNFKG